MDGPTFLFVYALVALAVIAAACWLLWIGDKTGWREPPRVPATFDPYEIAYLRGGKNAVIRTVLYALYHRGVVEIIPGKWLKASRLVAKDDLRDRTLTGLEERVLKSVNAPVEPPALFQDRNTLGSDVERLCEPFRNSLRSEQLLRSDADRNAALVIPWAATAILVALGLYRFMVSSPGRPVSFLIFLMVVALMLLWYLAGSRATAPISQRGRAYLNRIQTAYRDVNMSSVAMVGLFGIGILSETPDAAFARLFPKGGSDGGSSGCGSGGCGSGCGGCGGGD
jgi:uncharacterized protein (TIGR04222 family)